MKRCIKCDEWKPLDEFYPNKQISNGLHCYCKSCTREYAQQYRERTKDSVFAAYGGYICACCGETERKFLTIDHVENNGADHRKRTNGGGTRLYEWLKTNHFPDGFQVLCMNCNMGKSRNGGICPHQMSATYTGGKQ